MRDSQPVEAEPNKIITRLAYRGETVAFRVSTWVGKRFATETQSREWLRRNGFDGDEIRSLFVVADVLHVAASEVESIRALAAHGIRA